MKDAITKPRKGLKRPRVALVFDTSYLYTDKKKYLISSLLGKIISDYENYINLKIFIPEMVINELKAQTLEKALEIKESILKTATEFEDIAHIKIINNLAEEEIKEAINKRYNKLINERNLGVINVPYDKIDLKEIVNLSWQKKGLFESNRISQSKEYIVKEKGFKDYIILKSFEHYVPQLKKTKLILFVTNDDKLIDEITNINLRKIKAGGENEVISILKSIKDDVDIIWNKNLQPIASKYFYDSESRQGLWFSDSIRERILSDYKELFAKIRPTEQIFFFDSWVPKGEGDFVISDSRYEEKIHNRYVWVNVVKFNRIFQKVPVQGIGDKGSLLISTIFSPEEQVELEFQVKWEASISRKSGFQKHKILKIDFLKEKQERHYEGLSNLVPELPITPVNSENIQATLQALQNLMEPAKK